MNITTVPIYAIPRRLNGEWVLETPEELRVLYGLDDSINKFNDWDELEKLFKEEL